MSSVVTITPGARPAACRRRAISNTSSASVGEIHAQSDPPRPPGAGGRCARGRPAATRAARGREQGRRRPAGW
jgi:hypothetical protein